MAAFERATVGLFLWWSASLALADDPANALAPSRFDVTETVERIETGARSRGLKIIERTDHAALAERDGYRLQPTHSLLVDLAGGGDPVKLVVWQTRENKAAVLIDERARSRLAALASELPGLLEALAPAAERS
jgi:uncharacterized protein (DUF302 family)